MRKKLQISSLRRRLLPVVLPCMCSISTHASFVLEWDKIEHWSGSGECRSALIVQFNTEADPYAHVWGFRWNSDDYENGTPSGEDMFRAVASGSKDLLLFTQFTGPMGSTVDGIGYFDPEGEHLADHLEFDFENACKDDKISFDYFTPNSAMNQTKAPGNFTAMYCKRAIAASKENNILEHPINAREYGYPAYDYDYWLADDYVKEHSDKMQWRSGWYDGYWSYWVGGTDSDDLSYSGLGMTSRKLIDGQVDLWSFTLLDRNSTAYGDAVEPGELPLDYSHDFSNKPVIAIESVATEDIQAGHIYTLQGRDTGYMWPENRNNLEPGIYIIVIPGRESRKIMITQ
ncbi:MAG: hypothetical protein K2M56_03485 [Muribaculaceae bacterium]|nr:hypothetical protein [Muribaculaceae bacterium]